MTVRQTIITKSGIIFSRVINKRNRKNINKRSEKMEISTEAVMNANKRASERLMQIKVHHNFNPGDLHITLTYKGEPPSIEEAEKAIKNFLRRLRRAYKKLNISLKWIKVTEFKNKRIHHHLICSQGLPAEEIYNLWEKGYAHIRWLDKTKDYRRLVKYLIKETAKTFRDIDAPTKLRYSCSRNLAMPNVYEEVVDYSDIFNEPTAERGYYVEKDSIFVGENPFTGMPYLEYIQLPLNPGKTKKRKNQKKTKYKQDNHSKWLREHGEYQVELDELPF